MTQLRLPPGTELAYDGLDRTDRERLTTHTFTEVLRRQHNEDIAPQIIRSGPMTAIRSAAKLLQVEAGSEIHHRSVVLRGARTRRPLVYGTSAVVLDRLDPVERDWLLAEQVPLGDALGVAHLARDFLDWNIGIGIPMPAGRILAWKPGAPTINRLTRICRADDNRTPLALVEEWWPVFDPKASWD